MIKECYIKIWWPNYILWGIQIIMLDILVIIVWSLAAQYQSKAHDQIVIIVLNYCNRSDWSPLPQPINNIELLVNTKSRSSYKQNKVIIPEQGYLLLSAKPQRALNALSNNQSIEGGIYNPSRDLQTNTHEPTFKCPLSSFCTPPITCCGSGKVFELTFKIVQREYWGAFGVDTSSGNWDARAFGADCKRASKDVGLSQRTYSVPCCVYVFVDMNVFCHWTPPTTRPLLLWPWR